MNKITLCIQPFVEIQSFSIFKDNVFIEECHTKMEDLDKILFSKVKEYEINEIILHGNKDYLSKYKNNLNTTFNNNPIKITII